MSGSRRLDAKKGNHLVDVFLLLGAIDDAVVRDAVQRGKGQVVPHRHGQHQAFGLAVLRDEGHADFFAFGRRRAVDLYRRAIDQHIARAAPQHAEERQEKIALPLPVKAAEADNLACPHGQRDILEAVGPGQVFEPAARALCRWIAAAAWAGTHSCIHARS